MGKNIFFSTFKTESSIKTLINEYLFYFVLYYLLHLRNDKFLDSTYNIEK